MSNIGNMSAQTREQAGGGAARSLRRTGRIPAVIYGGEGEPAHVSLELRAFDREYQAGGFFSRLYDVDIDGNKVRVLPRDVQLDPVTDVPLHVDFLRYVKGTTITVEVPVLFVGEDVCPGLKQGGVLNTVRRSVELLCPVEAIPDTITLDITKSEIGDSLHISQIDLPDGVTPTITDRDFTVATIAAPTVMVEEVEAAEGEEGEEGVEGEEGTEDGDASEGDDEN